MLADEKKRKKKMLLPITFQPPAPVWMRLKETQPSYRREIIEPHPYFFSLFWLICNQAQKVKDASEAQSGGNRPIFGPLIPTECVDDCDFVCINTII